MIIMGIDPGTATTGYGIIKKKGKGDDYEILNFGVITTDKNLTDAKRLEILYEDLLCLMKKYKPDLLGIEKLFFSSNQTTAITVSQARGVALLAAMKNKMKVCEFTPLQMKKTLTGYGKADKKQVQYMVKQAFGLKHTPKPDDAADALGIAICAAHHRLLDK